jgi:hypothetical protein
MLQPDVGHERAQNYQYVNRPSRRIAMKFWRKGHETLAPKCGTYSPTAGYDSRDSVTHDCIRFANVER